MLNYPQVALDSMNRDHAKFAALRDKLLGVLSAQFTDAEVDTLLDELLEHTRRHFAEEERLMQEIQFQLLYLHKSEHDSVLAEMSAQIERWKHGRDAAALRDWLEHTVSEWFVNHVSTRDTVTSGFIRTKHKAD